jgi:hypothetical protein
MRKPEASAAIALKLGMVAPCAILPARDPMHPWCNVEIGFMQLSYCTALLPFAPRHDICHKSAFISDIE